VGDRVNAGRRAAVGPEWWCRRVLRFPDDRRGARGTPGVVLFLFLAGLYGAVGATPAIARGQAPRRLDLVVVTPDPSVFVGFRRAIAPMLRRRPVAARVVRGADLDRRDVLEALDGVDEGVVKVWVDARPGRSAVRVLLVHGEEGRVLVRTVSGGGAEADLVLAREQVAQILVAALDSLRAGEGVGVTRDRAQADLAAPARPRTPPRRARAKTAPRARTRTAPRMAPRAMPSASPSPGGCRAPSPSSPRPR